MERRARASSQAVGTGPTSEAPNWNPLLLDSAVENVGRRGPARDSMDLAHRLVSESTH